MLYFSCNTTKKDVIFMANSVNKYSSPAYYRRFWSASLGKEELLKVLAEDSERLMHRGVSFTIHLTDFADNKEVHVAPIYINNFTPYHDHDYYELNYVFSGELLEYIDGRPFVLTRGDMLVMAPNVRHCANPYKKARSYNVLVSNHLVETTAALLGKFDEKNYLAELIKTSGFLIFHNVHTEVEPLIGDMHDLARRSKSKVKFRVPLLECQGQELLIRLCAHPHDIYVREENVLRENLTEKMLANRILSYIRDNIATVSLEQLSLYFGYSKRQIERLVEKYSGHNYAVFVCNYRRSMSCKLLRTTDMSVSQIAAALGLGSPEYFCRWFKHWNGCKPSLYRKHAAEVVEVPESRQIVQNREDESLNTAE